MKTINAKTQILKTDKMNKLILTLLLIALYFCAFSQNSNVTTTTGTAENLYYKNGNLGIGTITDPSSRLTIEGPLSSYPNHKALYIKTEGASPSFRDQVMIYSNLSNGYGIAFAGQNHHRGGLFAENFGGTESSVGQLTLWSRNNGNIILNAGKVGIGTTTPDYELTIGKKEKRGRIKVVSTINASAYYTIENNLIGGHSWTMAAEQDYWSLYDANNKSSSLIVSNSGNVGIGTTNTGTYKLAVDGTIGAREIKVEATGWSDFVFEDDYKLKDLEEVESFIKDNKHLPDVPSEKEVLENGIQLGEMDAKLLQKIEELTLYMIEQNKTIKELQTIIKRNNLK